MSVLYHTSENLLEHSLPMYKSPYRIDVQTRPKEMHYCLDSYTDIEVAQFNQLAVGWVALLCPDELCSHNQDVNRLSPRMLEIRIREPPCHSRGQMLYCDTGIISGYTRHSGIFMKFDLLKLHSFHYNLSRSPSQC